MSTHIQCRAAISAPASSEVVEPSEDRAADLLVTELGAEQIRERVTLIDEPNRPEGCVCKWDTDFEGPVRDRNCVVHDAAWVTEEIKRWKKKPPLIAPGFREGDEYLIPTPPELMQDVASSFPVVVAGPEKIEVTGFTNPFTKSGPSALEARIKDDVIKMITWGGTHDGRSLQKEIGPSEIGNPCARALAYRIWELDHPGIGRPVGVEKKEAGKGAGDPTWYSVIGTALHAWLADTVAKYITEFSLPPAMIEQRVTAIDDLSGTSDLFWSYWDNTVVDWKVKGKDEMTRMAGGDRPQKYLVQGQIYGMGVAAQGLPVHNIAQVYLPRSGRLRDLVVHVQKFDPDMAGEAIERRFRIGNNLQVWEIGSHPERWGMIPASPGKDCFFCPYRNDKIEVAGPTGCPGR